MGGTADFLILIVSFLAPPSDPFLAVLEREVLILLFVSITWAWVCLGIRFADMARTVHDPSAPLAEVITGKFLEPGPTAIFAVFLFLGSAAMLYTKTRQGPGPFKFACDFSAFVLDIPLTTAVLFPYPFYQAGTAVVLPIVFHSALALITSLIIFPTTISEQFAEKLQGTISPLIASLKLHRTLLQTPADSPSFVSMAQTIVKTVNQSEAALGPLAGSARLLSSDILYSRFAPNDFCEFQDLSRRFVGRANGLARYFTLIDPTRERFPTTPAPSLPNSPLVSSSPQVSSPPRVSSPRLSSPPQGRLLHHRTSVEDDDQGTDSDYVENVARGQVSPTPSMLLPVGSHSRPASKHHHTAHHHTAHNHHAHQHHLLHKNLLKVATGRVRKQEAAVGVFAIWRYLDIEAARSNDPNSEQHTRKATELLSDSCDDLLRACIDGLVCLNGWLTSVRANHIGFFSKTEVTEAQWQSKITQLKNLRKDIAETLKEFRVNKRHIILQPYRLAFETPDEDSGSDYETPPHRHLFNCYVYQYHLIQISEIVIDGIDEIIKLEELRKKNRLWTPGRLSNPFQVFPSAPTDDDDDPETIQGVKPSAAEEEDALGQARHRDPDALPPKNVLEWCMYHLYLGLTGLGRGNMLFSIKAGIFSVVICLVFFLRSSATFAYENRAVWAIIMFHFTISRFRGDTAYILVSRIIATFLGGLVGAAMWYISSGSGDGNPYGLAAVCAVFFPIFFFIKLYCPIMPLTTTVFALTASLVVGYSYQDVFIVVPGAPGFGITVAWKRFIPVVVGVVAAFLVSLLPPATTIRRYHRTLLATTSSEIGVLYCSIISFAHGREVHDIPEIVQNLIAIRSKLKKALALKENVMYEFSLRGTWPARRYELILDLQLSLSYTLSHLMSVIEHMEPTWTRAFLRRTRFLDPDFQGDILAVITMISTSLKTGNPLPQITPCPLLDRFNMHYHGLDVFHKENKDDYGIPHSLTFEMLQNEQYMMFCVGVSTAFAFMHRLDRLMMATKEVVGERYHIRGLGHARSRRARDLSPRSSALQFRPPQDV